MHHALDHENQVEEKVAFLFFPYLGASGPVKQWSAFQIKESPHPPPLDGFPVVAGDLGYWHVSHCSSCGRTLGKTAS